MIRDHHSLKATYPEHENGLVAELVTRGPQAIIENYEAVHEAQGLPAEKERAEIIISKLGTSNTHRLGRIQAQLAEASPEEASQGEAFIAAADEGDEEAMKALGFSTEYAWIDDIVATMLSGYPPVEIETISPSASMHQISQTGEIDVDIGNIPPEEAAGMELTALLRTINPEVENTRFVSIIDELHGPNGKDDLNPQQQARFIESIAEFYREAGVLLPNDIPGESIVLLKESELAGRVDELIQRLRDSDNGQVQIAEDGSIYFRPTPQLIETLAIHSPERIKELKESGILLRSADGKPTHSAIDTASFLDPANKEYMHVVVMDNRMEAQQDKTYALLRSLKTVKQERYHNIFFDSTKLSPDLIAYGFGKIIQKQTERFVQTLDAYDAWESFDPYEYVKRNYGEGLLPEDAQIIDKVITKLAVSGIKPKSLKRVADIGAGPNIYPAMLTSPYVAEDSSIELIEYSPSNREYLERLQSANLPNDHQEVWKKFEQRMVSSGGDIYKDCEQGAKQKVIIKAGNIFDLPQDTYDLLSSYFVSESIVDRNFPFREAIQSMAKAMKLDGTMIVAHMVGSEGYYAGEGTHFPAVNLTLKDLEETYRDADLEFEIFPVGENVDKKAREGYHGMALVIAKRKKY